MTGTCNHARHERCTCTAMNLLCRACFVAESNERVRNSVANPWQNFNSPAGKKGRPLIKCTQRG
jgi:hypothetical protein